MFVVIKVSKYQKMHFKYYYCIIAKSNASDNKSRV